MVYGHHKINCPRLKYYRDPGLDRRIRFVHNYVLAIIWLIAQIYPIGRMSKAAEHHDVVVHMAKGHIQFP